MLIRVAGKLTQSRTFAARIEADSAIEAVVQVRKSLQSQEPPVADGEVLELSARPMKGKNAVHIGKAKAPKGTAPAASGKKK